MVILPRAQGRTPAEAAGIKVEGEDRWRTLIQNASVKSPNEFGQAKREVRPNDN
ncbi:MAG: hypothetical protein ACLQEQ_05425 [Nitrososphaerales archaeon]